MGTTATYATVTVRSAPGGVRTPVGAGCFLLLAGRALSAAALCSSTASANVTVITKPMSPPFCTRQRSVAEEASTAPTLTRPSTQKYRVVLNVWKCIANSPVGAITSQGLAATKRAASLTNLSTKSCSAGAEKMRWQAHWCTSSTVALVAPPTPGASNSGVSAPRSDRTFAENSRST